MIHIHLDKTKNIDAYATLTTVLLLLVVATLISITAMTVNLENLKATENLINAKQAKYIADSCAETAVNKLKDDPNYAGSENFTISEGTCEIRPVTYDGITWTIQITGFYEDAVRKLEIELDQVVPSTSINRWEQVADFQ